jgi:hypothetical protein
LAATMRHGWNPMPRWQGESRCARHDISLKLCAPRRYIHYKLYATLHAAQCPPFRPRSTGTMTTGHKTGKPGEQSKPPAKKIQEKGIGRPLAAGEKGHWTLVKEDVSKVPVKFKVICRTNLAGTTHHPRSESLSPHSPPGLWSPTRALTCHSCKDHGHQPEQPRLIQPCQACNHQSDQFRPWSPACLRKRCFSPRAAKLPSSL